MMKNCTSGNFDVGGNFDGVGQLLNGNYALDMHYYAPLCIMHNCR
jgi:hypothetical protein